ncbi:MAG: RNA polymerase sigma factor [Bryobacterales bacterium]|nr:RNA polymerase sigma factor [Bryobacterales bacterium]
MTKFEAAECVNSLFAEWYRPLLRYAVRFAGALSVAEDFVQEAFLSYYRALVEQRAVQCPKAYTMAAVRHQAQRLWEQRRAGRLPLSLDDVPVALVVIGEEERILIWDDLQRMISELTPREVEVLLLRAESLSYREIGLELGIAATSVGTLLARALKKLQAFNGSEVQPLQSGTRTEVFGSNPTSSGEKGEGDAADTAIQDAPEERRYREHENPPSSNHR